MNFKINLIKNKVPPLKKRRIISLTMASYLCACALLFVFLGQRIIINFMQINNQREKITDMENRFCREYSSNEKISYYTENIRSDMALHVAKLKVIDETLSQRINLDYLLLGFYESLPPGVFMNNINLNTEKHNLSFDIITPADTGISALTASNLISAWKQNTNLMSAIKQIDASETKRHKKGNEMLLVLKFTCSLAE